MSEHNFKMPYKAGTEQQLTGLPSTLELGFYRVKITSDHKNASKVFAFSPNHTYTNTSLRFALDLNEDYDMNFKIELIVDDKPNAYIYDNFVRGNPIFENWIDKLFEIKREFPKNKLIKHLLSSLHGSLSRSNCIYRTSEAIESEGLSVSMGNETDYKIIEYNNYANEYYKLQDNKNPYRYPFRLKSFLSSYGRTQIANVALQKIDSVIFLHTDGVAFNKDVRLNFPRLIVDDKTTGLIEYKHVNKHSKV
jgi:hypothetical protein